MKRHYKFLLFMLLAPVIVSAQSNFKPGYVVTLKGETLYGFIDYREWDNNPDAINFKIALTDKNSTRYTASDIKNFSIDKLESFQSYTGPISTHPNDPNTTINYRDTSFRVATVFLKVLEKGSDLALYSYRDDLKIRFYIGDSPGYNPKELIFRVFIDPSLDPSLGLAKTGTTTENTFQKQLSAEALKYNELNDDIELYISRSQYDENDLLAVVNKINHVTKEEYNKTHYSGSSFNFFAGAGININTTSPATTAPFYTSGGRPYTSILPQVSAGINLLANPATGKLLFRLEIFAAQSKYISKYNSQTSPYVPTEASFNELALSAAPQVIYNFYNTDNFKVFAGIGMMFTSFKFSNSYLGSQNHDGSEAVFEANNPYTFNSSENAFIFKVGVQFTKHLAIYGSLESKTGITNGGYFLLSSNTSQVGLNYIF